MDEETRCEKDIPKSILRRFLHIAKTSFNNSSRATSTVIIFNEEKSIIGFPSGRRAMHNSCTGSMFPRLITNRSSITGVGG